MHYVRIHIVFFLTLLNFFAYAENNQKADSLINLLNTSNDSVKLNTLLTLSWDLRNSIPEKSIEYGLQAIDLANKFKDFEKLAKAHSFVGVAYKVKGDYSKSIDYYYKGLEIAKQHQIHEQEGFAYLNLANLHIYQEHYAVASENIKKAEVIANEINNIQMLSYVYVYSGTISQSEKKYDEALKFYHQALDIRTNTHHSTGQAACYKHIGDIYFEKGDYESAIANFDLSIEKFNNALDKNVYADILIKESRILINQKKPNQAKDLANKSLQIGKEIGAKLIIRDALQTLATISTINKDYAIATEYLQQVIRYNDTLFSQRLSEKIFSLEYELEKELRESKIELLNKDYAIKELEVKRVRIFNLALSLILILLAGIIVATVILLKALRKKTTLLEKQNEEIVDHRNKIIEKNILLNETNEKLAKSEDDLKKLINTKDKLFSIIAHDLRSPFVAMVGLTGILSQKAEKTGKNELSKLAFHVNDSSQKLLALIENMLHWSRSQTGKLKLEPRKLSFKNIADEVIQVMKPQADAKEIVLINKAHEDHTIFADYDSTSTVLRNLVSNSIKFSFNNSSVTIDSKVIGNNTVITIADQGIGMKEENIQRIFAADEKYTTKGTLQEPGTGLGLLICKEFIVQNQGTIEIESKEDKGTSVIITLPTNS